MSQTATKNNYRANFILDTRTFQEPIESLIEKITGVIESIEGEVKGVNNMGQIDFVRVVDRKFPAGIYVQFDLEAPGAFPSVIQEKFRLDKTINRIVIQTI